MDDDFELIELQYPSVFKVGTYVQVVKVANPTLDRMIGQIGVVKSHRTHHNQRWNRVSLDDNGNYDFLTQELQKVH